MSIVGKDYNRYSLSTMIVIGAYKILRVGYKKCARTTTKQQKNIGF